MPLTHVRKHLSALVLGAAPLLVLPAAAQTTTPPSTDQAAADKKVVVEEKKSDAKPADDGTVQLEKVEVTGSRIRSLNGEATALPVFTMSQVELEQRGVNRLADIRWAIPQLAASRGYNDNLTNSGTSRAQTVGTSINLRGLGNTTTLILIDGHRIPHTGQEAPGGAGGREDYNMDGIPVSAIDRIEVLTQGASAIYGADAITGVVNIILKKNFVGSEVRFAYDNTFSKDAAQKTIEFTTGVTSGKWRIFASGSYEEDNAMLSRDRWFTSTYDLTRFGGTSGLNNPPGPTGVLRVGSTIYNIPVGSKGGGNLTVADYSSIFTAGQGIDIAPYTTQIDPARKTSATARISYTHAAWLELYASARWNRTTDYTTASPESFFLTLPAGYPGNPFGTSVTLQKYFTDLAPPRQVSYFENPAVVVGAKGKFLSDWEYDASYSWARNVVSDTYLYAPISSTLLNAAIAGSNPPILAYDSSTPGTNPNPAGYFDTLRVNGHHKDTSDTSTAGLQANGPLYTLPTGTISLAAGAETQLDTVKFFRDGSTTYPFVLSAPVRRVTDSYYAELQVPLLSAAQKVPLVDLIQGGVALRHDEVYDIKKSATTPTYTGIYRPFKWLTFRGSRSEGFKVPRLYDLRAPVSNFITNYTASRNVFDTLRNNEPVLGPIPNTSGGNPYLLPESSVSKGLGVALDVPWVKGLSFSADSYDLKYKNKSGSTSLQTLINYFPERITRGPSLGDGLPGKIVSYDGSNVNLAYQTTKGVDYSVRYERATAWGRFNVSATLSVPQSTFTKSTPAAALTSATNPTRFSGQAFWSQGAWSAGTSVDYQASNPAFTGSTTILASLIQWSPQVSYDFGRAAGFGKNAANWWGRWLADTKVSVTLPNVFKNEPTLQQAGFSTWVGDPRLNRYILSLDKKF